MNNHSGKKACENCISWIKIHRKQIWEVEKWLEKIGLTIENNDNYVKLLRKSSLNENKVCGNRNFWKVVCQTRPLQKKKITIMEGDDFMKYGEKTAKVFNTFFQKQYMTL